MLRSNRTWWLVGALIAVAILALLAAVAGRQGPFPAGSLGLLAGVPLTTALATLVARRRT